ncbi:unnamed protein product [Leptidea sinapis]|uniref:Rhabdovirus nucleocapsid domain-containing protein n=1 Tax=Leptidea sinapis TaxID=189913 RepID=A0A5E4R588_9NEOP|nr:unnamed protein product [Leptidea sinapis]
MAVSLKRTHSVHIVSRKKVDFKYVDSDSIVDYPRDWFQRQPGARPPAIIPTCNLSTEDIYAAARGGIRSASLSLSTAKLVLHNFGQTIRETLDQSWESYGVLIGSTGTELSPLDLFNITRGEPFTPGGANAVPSFREPSQASTDPANWSVKSLVLYILCLYRILRTTNEEYRTSLIKKMEDQLKTEGGSRMTFHEAAVIYGSWINDKNYT